MPRSVVTRVIAFALNNSLLLVAGAVTALAWANLSLASYAPIADTIHFGVDDIGMVFFFALAAKEVYEAALPGGPLASPKRAAVPLIAAAGGMIVPAGLYMIFAAITGRADLARGWAIPTATDIAFSYLVVRMIFRSGHPAIPFLLLLAIADDAFGLIVLAVFYPAGPVQPIELVTWVGLGIAAAWWLRRRGVKNFWAYVLGPGVLSWLGLVRGGLHPALAMVPIVPFMPHHRSDLVELGRTDIADVTTLQRFERWWRLPVQIILFFFGLANAGVPIGGVGSATWIVLGSLVIGKPLGIVVATKLAGVAGLSRDAALDDRSVWVTGMAAGIGFTVALFFAAAAFPAGSIQNEAKLGALLSVLAAPIAIMAARLFRT